MAFTDIAANAYANPCRAAWIDRRRRQGRRDRAGQSFASLLKDAVGSVLDSRPQVGRAGDRDGLGKANMMDVVTAVAETDVAVSTLVSVRDKVIPAYEDIMKMPI